MKNSLLNKIRYTLFGGLIPQGRTGIRLIGHHRYVGGKWDEIGQLQFDFLVAQGLKPDHCFLDIGCGALRGGVHFISYLAPGNYLGLDRQKEIVERGLRKKLTSEVAAAKMPEFVVSDCFEFDQFSKKPQYSLALSLYRHLDSDDIRLCLKNLREFVPTDHRFFATFFEGNSEGNRAHSNSLDHFDYGRDELVEFADPDCWQATCIGDWNHPRDQMMMMFKAV